MARGDGIDPNALPSVGVRHVHREGVERTLGRGVPHIVAAAKAAMEPTLTMAPDLWSTMVGTTCLQARNTVRRETSITRSKSSTVVSTTLPGMAAAMLFTRMSTVPKVSRAAATMASQIACSGQVAHEHRRRAAHVLNEASGLFGAVPPYVSHQNSEPPPGP